MEKAFRKHNNVCLYWLESIGVVRGTYSQNICCFSSLYKLAVSLTLEPYPTNLADGPVKINVFVCKCCVIAIEVSDEW